MNPGYVSLILALITLILLASGWKDVLFKGLSHRAAFVFFVCWIPTSFVQVQVSRFYVDLSIFLFVTVCLFGLGQAERTFDRFHLITLGTMLGAVVYLLQEMVRMSPAMIIRHPQLDLVVALVLLTVMVQRGCIEQITVLTLALLVSHFLAAFAKPSRVILGGAAFQDQWWQSIITARFATTLLEGSWRAFRRISGTIAERRKDGWK